MTAAEVLEILESKGTEQARKTYRRHGAGENVFGVSYADFKALKKSIKVDQRLAEALWETGNHDARVLATMIADPKSITPATLDRWGADLANYVLADAVAGLAAQTPSAVAIKKRWAASKNEWTASASWTILAGLAMNAKDLDDRFFEDHLIAIEKSIRTSPNRVRHTMNGAVIAIGIRNPELRAKAIAAAKRIGKVEVDHGDTGCQTPEASAYIEKVVARKE